jgi:nitrite reductase (cytochrome c-552)
MKSIKDIVTAKPWVGWLIFLATLVIVFLVGLFGSSIIERRNESTYLLQFAKPINPGEPRSQIWGESFPREYETYLLTRDTTFRSKYAGSATVDMLQRYPDLVILWAGYAFA